MSAKAKPPVKRKKKPAPVKPKVNSAEEIQAEELSVSVESKSAEVACWMCDTVKRPHVSYFALTPGEGIGSVPLCSRKCEVSWIKSREIRA